MNTQYETDSERVFTKLCQAKGYSVHKIAPAPPQKTPDFEVTAGDCVFVAEVKQFNQNEDHENIKNELEQDKFHTCDVDFSHDGALRHKLGAQAAQLRADSQAGMPTLGVIYSNRFLGPTDYQVQAALKNSTVKIPSKISAVLYVRNETIEGMTPPFTLHRNDNAAVPFPDGVFCEENP